MYISHIEADSLLIGTHHFSLPKVEATFNMTEIFVKYNASSIIPRMKYLELDDNYIPINNLHHIDDMKRNHTIQYSVLLVLILGLGIILSYTMIVHRHKQNKTKKRIGYLFNKIESEKPTMIELESINNQED